MMQTWQNSVQAFVPRAQKTKKFGATGELSPERIEEMEQAYECLYELTFVEDILPEVAAAMYYERFPNVDPYPLRRSRRAETQKAWGKFNKDTQPARRLFKPFKKPCFHTLHTGHVGLDPYYGDAANFPLGSYDKKLRKIWLARLKEIFGKNFFYKFEYGERFHVHVIAEGDKLLHIPRGGEVVKPIESGTEIKLLAYLYKPHATNTKENLAAWIHAKREILKEGKDNLPPSCGYIGLESVEDFNRSALNKATPTNTTNTNIIVIKNNRNKGRYEDDLEDDVYQLPEIIDISKIDRAKYRAKYRDYG